MTQQHPITPPPKLAAEWVAEIYGDPAIPLHPITLQLIQRAAQWGADQELEACLGEVSFLNSQALADRVRAARRPKPPSLKDRALKGLAKMIENGHLAPDLAAEIRAVLEMAPDE
jgi:hypothetical protein